MKDGVRWGLIAGVVFLGLGLAATILFIVDSPDLDAGGQRVRDFYEDRTAAIIVATILYALAAFAFAFFLGAFRAVLRSAEGGAGIFSSIAMGAGLAGVAVLLASNGATWAAVNRADDDELSRDSAQTLWDLAGGMFVFAHPLIAAFLAASGWILIKTGVLPAWLGWVAVVAAAGLLCPFISWWVFALVPIWVGAVSVILLDRADRLAVASGEI